MRKELEILISHYTRKPRLGIWATILKGANTFLGASGLVYYDNKPEIEIGYRMLKEHWNNGYTTEASIGLLKHGFKTIGLRKIVSSAHVETFASRRVMEKLECSTLIIECSTTACRLITKLKQTLTKHYMIDCRSAGKIAP